MSSPIAGDFQCRSARLQLSLACVSASVSTEAGLVHVQAPPVKCIRNRVQLTGASVVHEPMVIVEESSLTAISAGAMREDLPADFSFRSYGDQLEFVRGLCERSQPLPSSYLRWCQASFEPGGESQKQVAVAWRKTGIAG